MTTNVSSALVVERKYRNPSCSLSKMLLLSRYASSLLVTILSNNFPTTLVKLIAAHIRLMLMFKSRYDTWIVRLRYWVNMLFSLDRAWKSEYRTLYIFKISWAVQKLWPKEGWKYWYFVKQNGAESHTIEFSTFW